MAKGQMRSNREKKKQKQDKNKKKGAEASSFAGMHSQVKPGTSYMSQSSEQASCGGLARLVEMRYVTEQPQRERKTLYIITDHGRQALANAPQ